MSVFNNWDVVAKGWYIACPSRDLPVGKAKSLEICGQKIVLFRGSDGRVGAIDAYCPHMGTDLGIGRVDRNLIRCYFHHWAFDRQGNCQDIPCLDRSNIPAKANVSAYATDQKYGFIWVYPDRNPPAGVAEFDELSGKEIVSIVDRKLQRNCHHHICMMNGIDAQHLQTVHKLDIEMELSLQQHSSGNIVDFTLKGEIPQTNLRGKIARKILGENYTYTMRYADGCIGMLTIMKNVRLIPPLHMIYAYVPLAGDRTEIQPIYIAAKRQGLLGWLKTRLLLLLTRLAYYALRDEDGQIYDNIRFKPNLLLSIDAPIAKYMEYVNQLDRSNWSRHPKN